LQITELSNFFANSAAAGPRKGQACVQWILLKGHKRCKYESPLEWSTPLLPLESEHEVPLAKCVPFFPQCRESRTSSQCTSLVFLATGQHFRRCLIPGQAAGRVAQHRQVTLAPQICYKNSQSVFL